MAGNNKTTKTTRFDAVLCDLDGTLLDTLEDIADSANHVLASHDHPTQPLDAFRYFVGDGARTLVERVLPASARNEETIDRLYGEFRQVYGQRWKTKTEPYDGIPDMLDGLIDRGLKLAVLSNKPDDFTKKCVEELLSPWTFDVVLGHHEGIPPKPDPTGALQIIEHLGTSPGRILYLGDSSIDMKTAIAAGMFPVGVLWGFRTLDELKSSGARATIGKPSDVFALL